MNAQQTELYQRIQAFSLDDSEAEFSFSKRLARDNTWSTKYTQRVIDEYKKFAFLAVVAGHPVTPSDQVDQVWHLHLIYTHSYWGEFCPNVLQTPLHHGPTRGGRHEGDKFNDWYTKTLASYERFFGHSPPADIWPSPHLRFGRDLHFLRVNTQQNWVLPKPPLELSKLGLSKPPIALLFLVLALSVTGCSSLSLASLGNPLDFNGPEFLKFYSLVAIAAVALAYILRWCLRSTLPASDASSSLNTYEIAYLAGGKNRAVDTAIVSLVQRGYLQLRPLTYTLKLTSVLPSDSRPLERELTEALNRSGKPYLIRQYVTSSTDLIKERLQNLGLLTLTNSRQARVIQWLSVLPIFAVLLLGIAKIVVGISRDKPVGFLLILCLITGIVACYLLMEPDDSFYLTLSGDRTLRNLQARHKNLKKPSVSETEEIELAFGLFGSVVLANSSFADLKRLLAGRWSKSTASQVSSSYSGTSSSNYSSGSSSTYSSKSSSNYSSGSSRTYGSKNSSNYSSGSSRTYGSKNSGNYSSKSSSNYSSKSSGNYNRKSFGGGGGIDSSCDSGGGGSCGDGGDGGCGGCGGCGGGAG